jgi:hypothetical protein
MGLTTLSSFELLPLGRIISTILRPSSELIYPRRTIIEELDEAIRKKRTRTMNWDRMEGQ